SASSLIVSTGGPVRRKASERSPPSLMDLICKLRFRVSGLYCSTMMRCTAPLEGSIRTMPPLSKRGEFGKVVIRSVPRLDQQVIAIKFSVNELTGSGGAL